MRRVHRECRESLSSLATCRAIDIDTATRDSAAARRAVDAQDNARSRRQNASGPIDHAVDGDRGRGLVKRNRYYVAVIINDLGLLALDVARKALDEDASLGGAAEDS